MALTNEERNILIRVDERTGRLCDDIKEMKGACMTRESCGLMRESCQQMIKKKLGFFAGAKAVTMVGLVITLLGLTIKLVFAK